MAYEPSAQQMPDDFQGAELTDQGIEIVKNFTEGWDVWLERVKSQPRITDEEWLLVAGWVRRYVGTLERSAASLEFDISELE